MKNSIIKIENLLTNLFEANSINISGTFNKNAFFINNSQAKDYFLIKKDRQQIIKSDIVIQTLLDFNEGNSTLNLDSNSISDMSLDNDKYDEINKNLNSTLPDNFNISSKKFILYITKLIIKCFIKYKKAESKIDEFDIHKRLSIVDNAINCLKAKIKQKNQENFQSFLSVKLVNLENIEVTIKKQEVLNNDKFDFMLKNYYQHDIKLCLSYTTESLLKNYNEEKRQSNESDFRVLNTTDNSKTKRKENSVKVKNINNSKILSVTKEDEIIKLKNYSQLNKPLSIKKEGDSVYLYYSKLKETVKNTEIIKDINLDDKSFSCLTESKLHSNNNIGNYSLNSHQSTSMNGLFFEEICLKPICIDLNIDENANKFGINIDSIQLELHKYDTPVLKSQNYSLIEIFILNFDKLVQENSNLISTDLQFNLKSDSIGSKYNSSFVPCLCELNFMINDQTKYAVIKKIGSVFSANVIQYQHYFKLCNSLLDAFASEIKTEILNVLDQELYNKNSNVACCNCAIF